MLVLLAVVVVMLSTVALFAGKGSPDVQPSDTPPPVLKVALAPVVRTTLARSYAGVGELEAVRQVQLAAETGGRVTRIAFESGQTVAAGQLLVQLNDAPERAELVRLQAQLRNTQAQHARAGQLLAEKAGTQEQVDSALAARDMALGEVRRTEALIAQKALRAPFSGVVGIRRVHEGQYLNVADPVASLVDARTLYANFALQEQSVPSLKVGQVVALKVDAYPERSFPARVSAIDALVARSRTVQVQARLDNPGGVLRPGMYASVRVARPAGPPSLTVPETAVTYTTYGAAVFVARLGAGGALTVQRVAVDTGERQGGRVDIVSGLNEGDRVVTSGQLRLSDGMAVEAAAQDTLDAPQPGRPLPAATLPAEGAAS